MLKRNILRLSLYIYLRVSQLKNINMKIVIKKITDNNDNIKYRCSIISMNKLIVNEITINDIADVERINRDTILIVITKTMYEHEYRYFECHINDIRIYDQFTDVTNDFILSENNSLVLFFANLYKNNDQREDINYHDFIRIAIIIENHLNIIYVSSEDLQEIWQNYCEFYQRSTSGMIECLLNELRDEKKFKRFNTI